jgi:phosphatidylglycerol:prolipoprotein diacylglycerol transferase
MLPVLFEHSFLAIHTYPLMMGIAWGLGISLSFPYFEKLTNHKKFIYLWYWGVFTCAWIGAKLLFMMNVPENIPFSPEFSFWLGGGFVFYGGLLGALTFQFFWQKINPQFKFSNLNFLVPVVLISHGVGRIGCVMAGCCFGSELPTGHFLKSIHFVYYPVPLFESIFLILIGIIVLKKNYYHFEFYCIFYGALRFVLEFFRGDSLRGQWGIMTPSQWISLGLILVGLILVFQTKKPIISNTYN